MKQFDKKFFNTLATALFAAGLATTVDAATVTIPSGVSKLTVNYTNDNGMEATDLDIFLLKGNKIESTTNNSSFFGDDKVLGGGTAAIFEGGQGVADGTSVNITFSNFAPGSMFELKWTFDDEEEDGPLVIGDGPTDFGLTAVPLPASGLLLLVGLGGFIAARRRV